MVLPELAARLNCVEYKNWVKAGHCLLLLRGCLQGFVGREVLAFHRGLLAAAPGLGPRASCLGGSRCNPRARQVSPSPAFRVLFPESRVPPARRSRAHRPPGPSSPPRPVVPAPVSAVHRVEAGDFEASHQQERRRPLGKLPARPLAFRRLGGGEGKPLMLGGHTGVTFGGASPPGLLLGTATLDPPLLKSIRLLLPG